MDDLIYSSPWCGRRHLLLFSVASEGWNKSSARALQNWLHNFAICLLRWHNDEWTARPPVQPGGVPSVPGALECVPAGGPHKVGDHVPTLQLHPSR